MVTKRMYSNYITQNDVYAERINDCDENKMYKIVITGMSGTCR